MINSQGEFWKSRAENYNKLEWANEPDYIKAFINMCELKETDVVLDVGTGTGIIARAIAPFVKRITGIDTSIDMLTKQELVKNVCFEQRDIRLTRFPYRSFDKITARMVFHHIVQQTQLAMDECYCLLKTGGKIILAEGVPPNEKLKEDYTAIFKLKENRLVLSEDDLIALMLNAGFKNIRYEYYVMRNFSVLNWLKNSGLSIATQMKIAHLHVYSSDEFRSAYNMKIKGGDCFIDVKNVIITGEK